MTTLRLSPSGPPVEIEGGAKLWFFDFPAGPGYPGVNPSLVGWFSFSTDSFGVNDGELTGWIEDELALPPSLVFWGVRLVPTFTPGATADVVVIWSNIDPVLPVANWPNPFRLVVALYPKATAGNIVPP